MTTNNDNLNASDSNLEDAVQLTDGTVKVGNTTFTQQEIEEANKPQPNVILNTTDVNNNIASTYRDTDRVNPRAGDAADSTDTNTGGIISGGAKGVSQS